MGAIRGCRRCSECLRLIASACRLFEVECLCSLGSTGKFLSMFESVVLLAAACFRRVIGDLWHVEVGYGLVFLGVRSSYRSFDVWVCGWWF